MIATADEGDGALLLDFLRQRSYKVLDKVSGLREMLALVGKHKVGILFMDADLPGLEALEMLTMLRGKFAELNIIVMSAEVTKEFATEVMTKGGAGFLVKPLTQDAIQNVLSRIK
jgi:DNA-binding response OmpR family regulator